MRHTPHARTRTSSSSSSGTGTGFSTSRSGSSSTGRGPVTAHARIVPSVISHPVLPTTVPDRPGVESGAEPSVGQTGPFARGRPGGIPHRDVA
ncbi:hypothetical protein GCM10009564_33790 [Streptomyces thermogriseus]|uniref:Uncharacterized protein n=1 Tax=Streptomyces thermogriseus TaxID=75292 RepID=A0ABP4DLU0_9ACTN